MKEVNSWLVGAVCVIGASIRVSALAKHIAVMNMQLWGPYTCCLQFGAAWFSVRELGAKISKKVGGRVRGENLSFGSAAKRV